ncbi:MAG: prephenate dehydrogenase/arogenate dehydrogenase family protein [Anaerolineae bacterium]|jgi:prephenate dehydrogenase|nr:prephenate dehydrogenase/arogenate dehydrogenase family protein [Anaerolineae bacterium]
MAEISVAILGLGRLGASIGLALKRYSSQSSANHQFKITGYGKGTNVDTAQKLGAIHTTVRSAAEAVRGKDVIVVALPYAEVAAVYPYIAPDVRAGAVILDFSPLKQQALQWAKQHLPAETYAIGMQPIVNPRYLFDSVDETERASADLFDQGMMLVTPNVNALPAAVELAMDFGQLVGATSRFIDPAEHDSLNAAMEGLPTLIALAYFRTIAHNQGWDDLQKLTNPAFGAITRPLFDTHPDDLRDQWLHNRDSLLHYTDQLIAQLRELRRAVADQDSIGLESAVVDAAHRYEKWYNRRYKNQWDKQSIPEPENLPTVMSTLFGNYIANKLRRKPNKEETQD